MRGSGCRRSNRHRPPQSTPQCDPDSSTYVRNRNCDNRIDTIFELAPGVDADSRPPVLDGNAFGHRTQACPDDGLCFGHHALDQLVDGGDVVDQPL